MQILLTKHLILFLKVYHFIILTLMIFSRYQIHLRNDIIFIDLFRDYMNIQYVQYNHSYQNKDKDDDNIGDCVCLVCDSFSKVSSVDIVLFVLDLHTGDIRHNLCVRISSISSKDTPRLRKFYKASVRMRDSSATVPEQLFSESDAIFAKTTRVFWKFALSSL